MKVFVEAVMAITIAFWIGLACGCAPKEPASKPSPEIGGGSLPAEVSVRPEHTGEWPVAGGATLALKDDGRLELQTPSERIALAAEALELPAISTSGRRIAFAFRQTDGFGSAVAVTAYKDGAWTEIRVLVDQGTPDRVSISPDGAQVAYVASANGVAAIWIVALAGGAPVQLTNVGVQKQGPGQPVGFVPVPDRAPPRFEGGSLVWEAGDLEHRVVLP